MTFQITAERRSAISFVTVESGQFVSSRAYVIQRSLLRSRRREIATGSVAKAIEIFDAHADFELWMHQAADELARADLNEISTASVASSRASHGPRTEAKQQETRFLSYDEFMRTRVPDARSDERQNEALCNSLQVPLVVTSVSTWLQGTSTDNCVDNWHKEAQGFPRTCAGRDNVALALFRLYRARHAV